MAESVEKDITIKIVSRGEKQDKNDNLYWEFGGFPAGYNGERPITYRFFDHDAGDNLHVGDYWRVRIKETPMEKGSGKFRNITGVIEKLDGEKHPGLPESESEEENPPSQSGKPPTNEQMIMRQNATGHMTRAYWEWRRWRGQDDEAQVMGFTDHIKLITQAAEWVVNNYYRSPVK